MARRPLTPFDRLRVSGLTPSGPLMVSPVEPYERVGVCTDEGGVPVCRDAPLSDAGEQRRSFVEQFLTVAQTL